jgi:U3 small nucleolar RNA-associated protein 6
MGVRSTGSGQRTIFFLYNRAVRKFSGDLDLWVQYIDFARKEKAYKKLTEIFTSVVRLHPTKPDLWIYAAHYFMDTQADITNARSYMQRGLRFCKNSEHLWLQYAKLETIYVGKIAGRRKILGLDVDRTKKQTEETEDADMLMLPEITAEDVNPSLDKEEEVDQIALQNLASAPVLTGAIPIAIFDSAMKQFKNDSALAEQFFDMFAEFEQLPCLNQILQHVLDHLKSTTPQGVEIVICTFKMQLLSTPLSSPNFPGVLRSALELLNNALEQHPVKKGRLAGVAIRQILFMLRTVEELEEPALEKVLKSSLRKYLRLLEEANYSESGDAIATLVDSLQQERKYKAARRLLETSMKHYSANDRLVQLQQLLDT